MCESLHTPLLQLVQRKIAFSSTYVVTANARRERQSLTHVHTRPCANKVICWYEACRRFNCRQKSIRDFSNKWIGLSPCLSIQLHQIHETVASGTLKFSWHDLVAREDRHAAFIVTYRSASRKLTRVIAEALYTASCCTTGEEAVRRIFLCLNLYLYPCWQ